jgi:uncharacterized protein YjcR
MSVNLDKHKILLEHKDEIIEQYLNNVKVKDITKKYGVYPETIRLLLRKWGVPKRIKIEGIAKDKLSPELLAKRVENTRWNKLKVKFYPYPKEPFILKYSEVK